MAHLYPSLEHIYRLKVSPTEGELALYKALGENLGDECHIFFNPYLDGDRPDIIVLKENCGAIIIEVKDWHLQHYNIDISNKWSVQSSIIRSPFAQVFRYKSNLFNLHLPILGLKEALDKSFYSVIQCFVYFHVENERSIDTKYTHTLTSLNQEISRNNAAFKNKEIAFEDYETQRKFLQNKKNQISRDQRLSVGGDKVSKLIDKIQYLRATDLFSEDIFQEFHRRLSPPEHVMKQGIKLNYDKYQLRLIDSHPELKKVKGVAGCGKTSIMAQRAINAFKRHNSNVLILTFNLTLKNYIRDKVSDVRGDTSFHGIEITNYHQFFNAQLNNLNIDPSSVEDFLSTLPPRYSDEEYLEHLYRYDFFEKFETLQYQTIFIDEIQDYETDWVKIIRNNFLAEEGEMVLFGDQSQNIYDRDINRRESSIVRGFGRWEKLTKSYRSDIDSPLVNLFKRFQLSFLINRYNDCEVFEAENKQSSMNFDVLEYYSSMDGKDFIGLYDKISERIQFHRLIPNDTTILCSNIDLLRELDAIFRVGEDTMTMFESKAEYYRVIQCTPDLPDEEIKKREKWHKTELETIRRRKKNFFQQNSGKLKLSTTHSFKGLESQTTFCILTENDTPEIVYTAMTRATKNLIIFDLKGSQYADFFESAIT